MGEEDVKWGGIPQTLSHLLSTSLLALLLPLAGNSFKL